MDTIKVSELIFLYVAPLLIGIAMYYDRRTSKAYKRHAEFLQDQIQQLYQQMGNLTQAQELLIRKISQDKEQLMCKLDNLNKNDISDNTQEDIHHRL